MSAHLTGKRIAILATDGVEGVELTSPRQALKAAGATVEILAPESGTIQLWDHTEKSGTLPVDRAVKEADPQTYDGLVLPGGVPRTPTTCAWIRRPYTSSLRSSAAVYPSA